MPAEDSPWDADSVTCATKRELVEWLQLHASADFLAGRNLGGDATARAKKSKAAALQKVYLEWVSGGCSGASATPAPAPALAQKQAGGGISTVEGAVREIRSQQADIGVKKLVSEVKLQFPHLEQRGLKVGAKEIRVALKTLAELGEQGAGEGSSVDSEGLVPKHGMVLNPDMVTRLFGLRFVKPVRGQRPTDALECSNTKYKLLGQSWLPTIGREGPCRQIVLQCRAQPSSGWQFAMVRTARPPYLAWLGCLALPCLPAFACCLAAAPARWPAARGPSFVSHLLRLPPLLSSVTQHDSPCRPTSSSTRSAQQTRSRTTRGC
jgi:hypothetical protein